LSKDLINKILEEIGLESINSGDPDNIENQGCYTETLPVGEQWESEQ